MPESAVSRIRGLLQQGQDALEHRYLPQAELCFSRALGLAEDLDDTKERRDAYSMAGVILVRGPFANLALQAAQEALALDRQSSKGAGSLIADMLSYGSALAHLDRYAEAVEVFEQLLALCLAECRYADAASASTNLGACLARLGRLQEACKHFQESLGYLTKQSFPETELATRMNLLGLYQHMNEDPKTMLEFARQTLDWFSKGLPREYRPQVHEYRPLIGKYIRTAAARYLRSQPPAAKRYLRQRFPDFDVLSRSAKKGI